MRSATCPTRPRGGRRCGRRSPGRGSRATRTPSRRCRTHADPDRRARSADALVRSHRPGEHGGRQADAGHAGGLRQHADGAARLQRHHGEDDDRRRPGRAAPHDVHGAVRAARARRDARPPIRGDVHDPRRARWTRSSTASRTASCRATSPGRAWAASTRSRTPGRTSCGGSRRRRRSHRRATPTGSPGTGSTCADVTPTEGREERGWMRTRFWWSAGRRGSAETSRVTTPEAGVAS